MMNLCTEWRHAWKWLSVQLGAVVAVAPEVYEQVQGMKGVMSDTAFHHVMTALGILLVLNTIKRKRK